MSRKVFYSFHFDRDSQRAAQVRNSHALADQDQYGVIDAVDWEKVKRDGPEAIKRWINEQLKYTSVTAVLIGAETAQREWVKYEIRRSWERGNGLVGVRIHNVKKLDGTTDVPGPDPFADVLLEDGTALSSICKIYDWVTDAGITNLGRWVEEAFQARAAHHGDKGLKVDTRTEAIPSPQYSPQPPSNEPTLLNKPPKPWAQ